MEPNEEINEEEKVNNAASGVVSKYIDLLTILMNNEINNRRLEAITKGAFKVEQVENTQNSVWIKFEDEDLN